LIIEKGDDEVSKDQIIGALLVIISIIVVAAYIVLLFFPGMIPGTEGWDIHLIKITLFLAVAAVFGILAWIGYTLATTPPPKPIEELEKELEEELKKLEREEVEEKTEEEKKE